MDPLERGMWNKLKKRLLEIQVKDNFDPDLDKKNRIVSEIRKSRLSYKKNFFTDL